MGVNINKKTAFGPEGFLIARNNPDGTPASPDRILGFYDTVDLSAYAPQDDAYPRRWGWGALPPRGPLAPETWFRYLW